jgi:rRNA maturation endonuclease Nob1
VTKKQLKYEKSRIKWNRKCKNARARVEEEKPPKCKKCGIEMVLSLIVFGGWGCPLCEFE